MIFPKTILILFIISLTSLSSFSQEQLTKIKSKNLIGEWFSKDSLNSIKIKPVLTLYKNVSQGFRDSLATSFKIHKDESLKIIKKNNLPSQADTLRATWFFIEGSKNLKVFEKIKAESAVSFKASDGTQSVGDFFITKTSTFHVDFISENKMILRYIEIK